MNYKIEGAIKKNRKNFIIFVIIWIIIAIALATPIAYSFFKAQNVGANQGIQVFLETFIEAITNPFGTLGNIISEGAIGTYFTVLLVCSYCSYFTVLLVLTIFYAVCFFIGFTKSAPKNEFSDIEHGSSDWSQRGEQYTVLSKNRGIILAEDNCLPLDKRGNINVLVVGRIRFW